MGIKSSPWLGFRGPRWKFEACCVLFYFIWEIKIRCLCIENSTLEWRDLLSPIYQNPYQWRCITIASASKDLSIVPYDEPCSVVASNISVYRRQFLSKMVRVSHWWGAFILVLNQVHAANLHRFVNILTLPWYSKASLPTMYIDRLGALNGRVLNKHMTLLVLPFYGVVFNNPRKSMRFLGSFRWSTKVD